MRFEQTLPNLSRDFSALLVLIGSAAAAQNVHAAVRVNTYTASDQQTPAIASDAAGNSVIVWQSNGEDGSLSGIYAQRFAADGSRIGGEFRVNTFTTNLQILPAVAMDAAGDFVVVWDSVGESGAGLGVYGQRFAADGSPQGVEFQINSSAHDLSTQVGIAMDTAGNFAVVWPEHYNIADTTESKTSQILLRVYAADGTPRGAAIAVESNTSVVPRVPAVAMNASSIVVTWDANGRGHLLSGPAGLGVGIYARQLAADGTLTGAGLSFAVNALNASVVVDRPAIAIDAAGNFMIAWETLGTDLNALGVHARRYSSAGTAQAAEFAAGDAAYLQRYPALTMSANGRAAIAAHGDGIYLQQFDGAGLPSGATTRLDDAAGSVQTPAIAFEANGTPIVVWQDFGRDGDGRGISAVFGAH